MATKQQPTMAQIAAAYRQRQAAPVNAAQVDAERDAMPFWLQGALGLADATTRAGNAATLGLWGRGLEALTGGQVSNDQMQQEAAARLGKPATLAADALGIYAGAKGIGAAAGGVKNAVQAFRGAEATPMAWAMAKPFVAARAKQVAGALGALGLAAFLDQSPDAPVADVTAATKAATKAATAAGQPAAEITDPYQRLRDQHAKDLEAIVAQNPSLRVWQIAMGQMPGAPKALSTDDMLKQVAAQASNKLYEDSLLAAAQETDVEDRREAEISALQRYVDLMIRLGAGKPNDIQAAIDAGKQ